MKQADFPKGWEEDRVKRVLAHYENQSEEEAIAEDEAAWEESSHTFIKIPNDLVPVVREMLGRREGFAESRSEEYRNLWDSTLCRVIGSIESLSLSAGGTGP